MNLKYDKTDLRAIVYDADCIPQPDAKLFDPDFWRARGAIVGMAAGRGQALLLHTHFGPAVLRPYLRGGWAARLSADRYLFTGFDRSRPFREARILARLWDDGMPVPKILAGLCSRHGRCYTGSLLTRRIERAATLADRLDSLLPADAAWPEIGRVLRRFHDAGIVHADLNARNVLLSDEGAVHVLDFDRARFAPASWRRFRGNLERLRRSLVKTWPAGRSDTFEDCWNQLMRGYEGEHGKLPERPR